MMLAPSLAAALGPRRGAVSPPAPPLSLLGTLAASMSAGTWAQVTGTNQNAILGGQGGSSGSMTLYCTYFPWNPIAKRIEIVGQDHLDPGLPQSYARWDDALGVYVLAAFDDLVNPGGAGTPVHGYTHTQVDPTTGDIYHYPSVNHSNTVVPMWKLTNGGTTFVHQTDDTSSDAQVAIGSCWWSGAFTGRTLGARGAYMLFNSGAAHSVGNGEICIYDPTVGWLTKLTNVISAGYASDYNSVMAYSPLLNVALYGGGNANSALAFRLNSDGTHTDMPTVPGSGMGVQSGPICADPVTGKFLLLSNGSLYELDPTGSGSWSAALTGGRVPPAGIPNPTNGTGGGVAWCPIPDYGVLAVISQITGTVGSFYLYKHA